MEEIVMWHPRVQTCDACTCDIMSHEPLGPDVHGGLSSSLNLPCSQCLYASLVVQCRPLRALGGTSKYRKEPRAVPCVGETHALGLMQCHESLAFCAKDLLKLGFTRRSHVYDAAV